MSLHWTVTYNEDEHHGQLTSITTHYMWSIRHSDGKWMLSRKTKNRPGPFSVYAVKDRLNEVKEIAEAADE